MKHPIAKLFEVLICTPTDHGMGAPAMFWGPPGPGKTFVLTALAAEYGMPCQVLSPGLMGDGAFGVVPVPVGTGAATRLMYPAPHWADTFDDHGAGLVFVDEITTAAPALQPPLLGLMQQRRVGDHYLGKGVRVLGAGNPPEQAAAGYDLPLPLANRMGHFDWPAVDTTQWGEFLSTRTPYAVLAGAKKNGHATAPLHDLAALERRVAAGWESAWAKASGLTATFHARRDGFLLKMPQANDPAASRAWPSPRTWELATACEATAMILGADENTVDTLTAGFVGHGAAIERAAFRNAVDLPDPEDALFNGAWKHTPSRLDRSMAVLSSCATYAISPLNGNPTEEDKKTAKRRGEACWKLIETVSDALDICVPAAKMLVDKALVITESGAGASKVPLERMRRVLQAAGNA